MPQALLWRVCFLHGKVDLLAGEAAGQELGRRLQRAHEAFGSEAQVRLVHTPCAACEGALPPADGRAEEAFCFRHGSGQALLRHLTEVGAAEVLVTHAPCSVCSTPPVSLWTPPEWKKTDSRVNLMRFPRGGTPPRES